MQTDDIKAICDVLEFQIFSSDFSKEKLNDWLRRNPKFLDEFDSSSFTANRAQIYEFFESEVRKRPIRIADVTKPLETLNCQTYQVNSKWSKDQQIKLALIWEVFSRDLDCIHHHVVNNWNETRDLFVKHGSVVHFLSSDLQLIDSQFADYLQCIEHSFKSALFNSLLSIFKDPLDSELQKFNRLVNGLREKFKEKLITEVSDKLKAFKRLTKVQKYRLTQITGCTLSEVNLELEKQLKVVPIMNQALSSFVGYLDLFLAAEDGALNQDMAVHET